MLTPGLQMVEITERKLAEETLRRSEARYRDVVEHSVYGVCIVTSEGAATGTNAAMLRDVRLRNSYFGSFPDCESFSPAAIHGTATSAL
jgi:hypothetical protein